MENERKDKSTYYKVQRFNYNIVTDGNRDSWFPFRSYEEKNDGTTVKKAKKL